MIMSHRLAAALLAACALAPAQAQEAVDQNPLTTSDGYAVRESIDRWMADLSARKPDAVKAHVDEGALGLYQGALADYDAAAFQRALALTLQAQGEGGVWANEIEDVSGSGDLAVVRSRRTLTRADGSAAVMRLLEVYRRYGDGSWRLSRFIGFPG